MGEGLSALFEAVSTAVGIYGTLKGLDVSEQSLAIQKAETRKSDFETSLAKTKESLLAKLNERASKLLNEINDRRNMSAQELQKAQSIIAETANLIPSLSSAATRILDKLQNERKAQVKKLEEQDKADVKRASSINATLSNASTNIASLNSNKPYEYGLRRDDIIKQGEQIEKKFETDLQEIK